ncbi:anti sigma factor C-terminal domain-containing protein [Ornithinibacillus salinisoli]|uniref:Anti sigma factor C-terminal domain-containing protein n=1 Tax=Ornithinibacillus salinisoli TaxID=1848459 RepID=A0ABW4VVE4_9BACI
MSEDKVLKSWNDKQKLDKKQARKLVWKTRLSIGFAVVRVLFIIFLLYTAYMLTISIYYNQSGNSQDFERFVSTLVETRNPGISVEWDRFDTEISPLLTQKTSATLYRHIGDWEVAVGEVTAEKILFNPIYYSIEYNNKYINESSPYYVVPPDLLGRNFEVEADNSLLSQLEKMEDGYVVQVLLSTKKGMDPEALRKILSAYDIEIYQMPIYAGELTNFEVNNFGSSNHVSVDSLMLRPQIVYGEENSWTSRLRSLTDQESLKKSVAQVPKDLEWLVDQRNYFDKETDVKRLAYIKENGIQVYGATVTGPVREIERLMEEEMLHQFQLGGIEVWNWTEK